MADGSIQVSIPEAAASSPAPARPMRRASTLATNPEPLAPDLPEAVVVAAATAEAGTPAADDPDALGIAQPKAAAPAAVVAPAQPEQPEAAPPAAAAAPAAGTEGEAPPARIAIARRSTLLGSNEPLAPPEDPKAVAAALAAAEAEQAVAPADAPAARPVLRRGSTLVNTENLAPPEDPKAVAAAMAAFEAAAAAAARPATTSSAGPGGVAAIINPPAAPMDPLTGAPQVTEEMRQRSQGNFGGSAEAAPEAEAGPAARPSAPPKAGDAPGADGTDKDDLDKDDLDAEAPIPPLPPVDAIHALLMAGLRKPRDLRHAEVMSEIQELQTRRQEQASELARLRARQDQEAQASLALRAAAAQGGPGGAGGGIGSLFTGIGRGIGAVGGAVKSLVVSDPQSELQRSIGDIDQQLGAHRSYSRIALNGQYQRTLDAADTLYRTHAATRQQVRDFNADLQARPEGARFIADLAKAATDAKVGVAEMRSRVFSNLPAEAIGNPAVADLRQQASALLQNPEIGGRVRDIQRNSRLMEDQSDRLARGIKSASRNKIDMSALDGDFTDALGKMEGEDCLLTPPGGDRLDKLREKIAEMIRNLLEQFQAMFRQAAPASGPGGP